MTTPAPTPTLEELSQLTVDVVPALRWLDGLHRAMSGRIGQAVQACTGQAITEAAARQVAWAVLEEIGAYVRNVQATGAP